MKYGIGIDIGGTKVSMVLGTRKGKIIGRRQIPTLKHSRAKECVANIVDNLEELIKEKKILRGNIKGIGVGIPGAVDSAKGIVPRSPNLQGWKGIPLARILKNKFKKPVYMTNDANAAGMGEKVFGQAKKLKHMIYITVSTGVGGGIISHGRLLEGANYVGGEIGHITIVPNGNRCNCGQRGCLEAYASGTAIAKTVNRAVRTGKGKSLQKRFKKKSGFSAKEIAIAANKGDRFALEVFKEAGNYLGIGIGTLLNIFNPDSIIIGGGVMKSAPKIHWKAMLKSAKKHSWPEPFKKVKIKRTKLKDEVGNLGALALVFDKD